MNTATKPGDSGPFSGKFFIGNELFLGHSLKTLRSNGTIHQYTNEDGSRHILLLERFSNALMVAIRLEETISKDGSRRKLMIVSQNKYTEDFNRNNGVLTFDASSQLAEKLLEISAEKALDILVIDIPQLKAAIEKKIKNGVGNTLRRQIPDGF